MDIYIYIYIFIHIYSCIHLSIFLYMSYMCIYTKDKHIDTFFFVEYVRKRCRTHICSYIHIFTLNITETSNVTIYSTIHTKNTKITFPKDFFQVYIFSKIDVRFNHFFCLFAWTGIHIVCYILYFILYVIIHIYIYI